MSNRFFVDSLATEVAVLTGQEAHHAASVLRLKVGSEVELFDGRGGSAAGRITRIGRGEMFVAIADRRPPAVRIGPVVHLGFAAPKGKRLDWLLEKATELGAASLQPVIFERSIAGRGQLSEAKLRRWLGHCVAAAKQSGLNFLPELRPPASLAKYLAAAGGSLRLLGDPAGEAPLPAVLAGRAADQPIALLIGPEGGLAPAERAAAIESGVQTVRIGQTVLRTETAAIALLAAVMAFSGDASRRAGAAGGA